MKRFIKKWTESSLIIKILIGVIIGVILGIYAPNWKFIAFPGDIFVNALKAIAELMVETTGRWYLEYDKAIEKLSLECG